ncbi:branched-chain amino acid ABC transporter permease [Ectothiorhodospira shaposhnikovii]|uniref:branched-chain amino acid ABC transporter permease n=1 Tax=Ectothiorhodospira shaposhnikovii TaxID=1054 RepID=UPI00190825DC|nr:branched-chain amino acid ABC transporter permease [Ectothiorhodospira shaposhnikovii]MBK1674353.1 branched-chain amino acid ABC transporter permease [Ectothiorhodospira shaposhnikovii]
MALRLPERVPGLPVLALVLLLLPLFLGNEFHLDIATQIALIAATVVGLNLLVGYGGQVSLGHAAFFGMGAYASAILTGTYGWTSIPALLCGALLVAVLAWTLGRPILRLKGHYLSMATLGMGIIIAIVINNEGWLTGGPDGLAVEPLTVLGAELSIFDHYSLLGLEVSGAMLWYGLAALLLLLAVWIAQNLVDSPIGRALRAVHGSEVAARVVGVDTSHYKLLIFVISAVYASVMGSFYAHYTGFITPQVASFEHSIELITMVVLGGMASTYGVILGAVLLMLLPQLLTDFQDYEMMMFGLILMLTMIFMPKGLLPTLSEAVRRLRPRPATTPASGQE